MTDSGANDKDVLGDAELSEWLADIEATGVPGERRIGTGRRPAAVSSGLRRLLDDATTPAGPPEVLGAASPELRALVADRVSEGTRAAYEADWAAFDRWCGRRYRLDAIDATALVVAEYVSEMVTGEMALSTIRRRLSALRHNFEAAGRPSPTGDIVVRAAMDGARRRLGDEADQATPLSLADVRAIVSGLPIAAPNRPTMRRDQLAVALGWAGALRPGELVGLDVDDVHVVGDADHGDGGALLWLRSGKRAPTGRWVGVPFSSQWSTCPVRRYLAYVKGLARPDRSGPLFRHIDRHGKAHGRLTRRSVTPLVRRTVNDVLQLDIAGYEANSLRAGFVTECRDRGVDERLIHLQTGHAVPGQRRSGGILGVYDRPLDLLKRNALDPEWW